MNYKIIQFLIRLTRVYEVLTVSKSSNRLYRGLTGSTGVYEGPPGSTNGVGVTKRTHTRLARLVYPSRLWGLWRR